MRQLKKRLVIYLCVARAAAAFLDDQAWGIGLSFTPASMMRTESSLDLDVVISGLERGTIRYSLGNLASLKFHMDYEEKTVLEFDFYVSGTKPLVIADEDDEDESEDVWEEEASELSDLSCFWDSGSTRPPEELTLATLSFMGRGLTEDDFSSLNMKVGDKGGKPSLENTERENRNAEAGASESARMFLLGCGLVGLARLKRKLEKGR